MLSSTGYEAVGYFRSRYQPENETHPDIQLLLVTSLYGSALSNDRLKILCTKLNMNNKVIAGEMCRHYSRYRFNWPVSVFITGCGVVLGKSGA